MIYCDILHYNMIYHIMCYKYRSSCRRRGSGYIFVYKSNIRYHITRYKYHIIRFAAEAPAAPRRALLGPGRRAAPAQAPEAPNNDNDNGNNNDNNTTK